MKEEKLRQEISDWLYEHMNDESKPIKDMFNLCIEEDFESGALMLKEMMGTKTDIKIVEEELTYFVWGEFGEAFHAMEEDYYDSLKEDEDED